MQSDSAAPSATLIFLSPLSQFSAISVLLLSILLLSVMRTKRNATQNGIQREAEFDAKRKVTVEYDAKY
jgi:hypothetical protein